MPIKFIDVPTLSFSSEVIEQFETLNLTQSMKEKLFSFFKDLDRNGVHKFELMEDEVFLDLNTFHSGFKYIKVKQKMDHMLVSIKVEDESIQIVQLQHIKERELSV
ncbi:hypothetical protein [Bacillus sp. Marseille-P3661]|uniref:hypothetical protein n=1 Tax=Bacillus sp. Marseille-P3661 TaxID=1936234 RepID=UPI000C83248F|nr:hypothetical protein [Bacillus sp. Marseille-P3661]